MKSMSVHINDLCRVKDVFEGFRNVGRHDVMAFRYLPNISFCFVTAWVDLVLKFVAIASVRQVNGKELWIREDRNNIIPRTYRLIAVLLNGV